MNRYIGLISALILAATSTSATVRGNANEKNCEGILLSVLYEDWTGTRHKSTTSVEIDPASTSIDPGMNKAITLINLGHTIREALLLANEPNREIPTLPQNRRKAQKEDSVLADFGGIPQVDSNRETLETDRNRRTRGQQVAEWFRAQVNQFDALIRKQEDLLRDGKLLNTIQVARDLAQLIDEMPEYGFYGGGLERLGGSPTRGARRSRGRVTRGGLEGGVVFESVARPRSVALRAGGLQGWGDVKTKIARGEVPSGKEFDVAAFLRDFQIPLAIAESEGEAANQLMTAGGTHAYDPKSGRLYVALGTATAEKNLPKTRPPMDLALMIDRSGSMGLGGDVEGKKRRMDYAKDAAKEAVRQLLPGDTLALVAFDHQMKVFTEKRVIIDSENPASPVKDEVFKMIDSIEPQGGTLISPAMAKTAELLMQEVQPQYDENAIFDAEVSHEESLTRTTNTQGKKVSRVLLISDMQDNEWSRRWGQEGDNADSFRSIISRMQENNVGITAITIGGNQNKALAQLISTQGDGNALPVANASTAVDIVRELPKLVMPVVRNVKVFAKAKGFKLVRVDGVNNQVTNDASVGENGILISQIPALYTAAKLDYPTEEQGGGAIVLVFERE